MKSFGAAASAGIIVPSSSGFEQGFWGSIAAAPKQSGMSLSTASATACWVFSTATAVPTPTRAPLTSTAAPAAVATSAVRGRRSAGRRVKRTGSSTQTFVPQAARVAPTRMLSRAEKPMVCPRMTGTMTIGGQCHR